VIDSGTEFIATIEKNYISVETLEKIVEKIIQEVLSTKIILRIL
jgi:hypothetical protein